jgi:excisionase family DNA binding protein
MGLGKISIARRRLDVRNGNSAFDAIRFRSSETFRLPHGTAGNPAVTPDGETEGLVFHISELQARRLEAMAMPAHDGRGFMTASVQREGPVLVLRIESPIHSRRMLSCRQVAEMLGMSRRFVYDQAREMKLPAYRFGRVLRFDPRDVIQFLAGCLEGGGS